jgi:hypothetical protein
MPRKPQTRRLVGVREEAPEKQPPTFPESKDSVELTDENFDVEISVVDVKETSLKIGWKVNEETIDTSKCSFLLQWKLDGAEEWKSLPEIVAVPRVRLEHLVANTKYSFRVKRKRNDSSSWSQFSKIFTFSTLGAAAASHVKSKARVSKDVHDDDEDVERLWFRCQHKYFLILQ